MRYYLYISGTKVDMLLPQVPGSFKKKVAAKLGFDIKILSGEIVTERATLQTKVDRLSAVEHHITSTEKVGTIDEPEPWIYGEAPAKLGHLSENTDVIFFVIETSDVIMAMGGSSKHLIANVEGDEIKSGLSFTPRLLRQFEKLADRNPRFLVLPSYRTDLVLNTDQWAKVISDASRKLGGPEQRISFLAKRLLTEEHVGKTVILATPLYVSLEE